jgi:hypothetical protein
VRPIRDVGDDLAMLIRAWPSTRPDGRSILTARPLSIAVDPTRAHMSVIIENDGAEGAENGHTGASAFLDSFKVPPGWQLAEPTVSRLGSAGVGGGSGEGDRGERVRVQMVLTLPPASAVTTDPSVGRKP